MICHYWTDGLTGREKEISDVNLIFIKLLCDRVPILIHQLKIRNGVIFSIFHNRRIHQVCIYHIWLVDWQFWFWFENAIDNGDYNDGKHKKKNSEELIFREKLQHKKGLMQNYDSQRQLVSFRRKIKTETSSVFYTFLAN